MKRVTSKSTAGMAVGCCAAAAGWLEASPCRPESGAGSGTAAEEIARPAGIRRRWLGAGWPVGASPSAVMLEKAVALLRPVEKVSARILAVPSLSVRALVMGMRATESQGRSPVMSGAGDAANTAKEGFLRDMKHNEKP